MRRLIAAFPLAAAVSKTDPLRLSRVALFSACGDGRPTGRELTIIRR